ncbi:MAG TPA: response regulator [Stellaceae bacterium]|nr:response regulator [Stellaceae bacterium]
MLEGKGYVIDTLPDGRRALALLEQIRPDAVITDIVMPESEGIETIVAIRGVAPDLPIIAISGGGQILEAEFLDMALQLGATAALRKPFELAELLATLERLLNVPSG